MVASTFMPGRSTSFEFLLGFTRIFTGMRCTTLMKFPVAFCGGSKACLGPNCKFYQCTAFSPSSTNLVTLLTHTHYLRRRPTCRQQEGVVDEKAPKSFSIVDASRDILVR
jgi:hypothetical protein